METIKTAINLNNPIKILIPKPILDKVIAYIIEWENKCVPGIIEFLFQDDIFGYEIKKATIKIGSSDNFEIDKIFHLIYADDNKIDIILEMYEYNENNLTLIIMNQNGLKSIIADTRNVTKLNETIDWIDNQTRKLDEFLDDIISTL